MELRLAIGRDGLGIELGRPATLGCVTVTELAVTLPGVRFPLDVSGGVSRFRHRRGELARLGVEIDARAAEHWVAPRLRGLLGAQTPAVWIGLHGEGATLGLTSRDGEPARMLAFDVVSDASGQDVCLIVRHARGAGLTAPATALAIAALSAALGKSARREGARFTLPRAIARLTQALLPEGGARAPGVSDVRWTSSAAHADSWILHASSGAAVTPTEAATRGREASALTREGDDARAAGDLERARACDVAALERAPRHPEIAARIAEIDQLAGGRAEAALATLAEADGDPRGTATPLLAELLVEVGDAHGAIAAFARAAEDEPVPSLSARSFERAAELVADALDALAWLDRAVARAPSVPSLRWARVGRRLEAGRVEDALADVEHLEAMATGSRARHAVWRRAGAAWRAAGLGASAATLFERALRFVPDDPDALAGLGAALLEEIRPFASVPAASALDARAARGVALLVRAVELAEARGERVSAMRVDLARALADVSGDRPAAIARLRDVGSDAPEALAARALEGRWRKDLGDYAGASLAFARLRDLAAARAPFASGSANDAVARDLLEAAAFERAVRGDLLAAQRHLAVALRLCPRHPDVASAYRAVCAMIAPLPLAATTPVARLSVPAPDAAEARATREGERAVAHAPRVLPAFAPAANERPPPPDAPLDTPLDAELDAPFDLDEARAAARVEDLTRILQADPSRDDVVDELTALLMRLGRGLELLALLSARLEESTPARRRALLPAQRDVLLRLEAEARAHARSVEADLFRDARAALDEAPPVDES